MILALGKNVESIFLKVFVTQNQNKK